MAIKPPNSQVTPEAMEALAAQGISVEAVTDSEATEDNPDFGFPEINFGDFDFASAVPAAPVITETGDDIPEVTGIIVDGNGEATDERRSRRAAKPPADEEPERDPKTGPPDIHEWMSFFSKIVLRVIIDWYISWAFAGVDEDLLSDREIERLKMTEDERKRIARPFAEMSYKSKFMRKHGRMIVASGGAFDALVTLGAWTARVNRIAKKYKRPNPRQHRPARPTNGSSGQDQSQQESNGYGYEGTNGGHIAPGLRIFNPNA
jgi:hypothetical protein